ncbi:hypothetical protein KFE25_009765 [Diacronema lutheri]|uniref:CRAL-TRIO domain-containing protein n=1 Tax=Diacronema lutheri TaxID=2081491 RepID=A0A8J6C0F9_DIALT|nr:hypothetical protein KFE25_009765 [Diacronema lutheri]
MSFRSHTKRLPALEHEPLTPDEASVLLQARSALGDDFASLPRDVLVQFVRGYIDEADWAGSCIKHLRELVVWRQREGVDDVLARAPDRRDEFERMWRTSVIGEDGAGHPVVVESLGRIPASDFQAAFDEPLFLRHCAYNKETLRRLCIHTSHRTARRVYKFVVVLDMHGLSLRHTARPFLHMIKTYISAFGNLYPESLQKLYIVNAPLVFTGTWAIIRPLLHPLTARKIALFAHLDKATKAMEADGVTLGTSLDAAYASGDSCSTLVRQHGLASAELRSYVPAAELALYEDSIEDACAHVAAARALQSPASSTVASPRSSFARPSSAPAAPASLPRPPLPSVDERFAVARTGPAASGEVHAALVRRIDTSRQRASCAPAQLAPTGNAALVAVAPEGVVVVGANGARCVTCTTTTGTLEIEAGRVVHFALLLPARELIWFVAEAPLAAHLIACAARADDGPSAADGDTRAAHGAAPGAALGGARTSAMIGTMLLRRVHGGARHVLLYGDDGSTLCAKRTTGAAQIELAVSKMLGRGDPSIGAGSWVDLLAQPGGGPAAAAHGPTEARAGGAASADGAAVERIAGASHSAAEQPRTLAPRPTLTPTPTATSTVKGASGAGAPPSAPPMLLVLAVVASLCAANLAILGKWRLELTWE